MRACVLVCVCVRACVRACVHARASTHAHLNTNKKTRTHVQVLLPPAELLGLFERRLLRGGCGPGADAAAATAAADPPGILAGRRPAVLQLHHLSLGPLAPGDHLHVPSMAEYNYVCVCEKVMKEMLASRHVFAGLAVRLPRR